MEDSFSVRVEKAFGALAAPSCASIPVSNLRSLWSLTDDEIEKREWNHTKDNSPETELDSSSSSFLACTRKPSNGSFSRRSFKDALENDLEELDDIGNDDDYDNDDDVEAEDAQRSSKPDDYDDEQWEIKSNIGRDCTLDYEEEEDAYDKQAIGKEKSGDRLFMKYITDEGVDIDTNSVLPTSFRDFVRDPRANILAAKIRLTEDAEAANKLNALHVSEKVERDNDVVKPKSILKRKDDQSDLKLQKRVRFGSDCDEKGNDPSDGDREDSMETFSIEDQVVVFDGKSSALSQRFESAVPDYLRNPSRYTRYSLDFEGDMDEESNKRAYMDFLKLIDKSNTSEETEKEDLPSVTFISKKKKPGDEIMLGSAAVSIQNNDTSKEEFVNKISLPVGVAAASDGDADVSAMEEDPQAPEIDARRNASVKFCRQYRKKYKEEQDEPST